MSRKRTTPSPATKLWCKDRPIGAGSFGVVWDVRDPRNGKRVALKRITNVFISPMSALLVFRELKMLSTLKHDNVLAAIEAVQPPPLDKFEEVFVVTELLHSDLHQVITSDFELTSDQIRVFVYQLMRGLKYIHSAKVIHRDIKPSNILIYNNCILKIGDFGLARREANDEFTKMSLDVVTQNYRAPEIFLGISQYTGAIDIWSAACVIVEILGGKSLFDCRSDVSQLDQMMELLGTPSMEDIAYASDSNKKLLSWSQKKPSNIAVLRDLSTYSNIDVVDLLSKMLTFNPFKRISAAEALEHKYMGRGRTLYHRMLCKCCTMTRKEVKVASEKLEPVATEFFDDRWEQELSTVTDVKIKMHRYITERLLPERDQLDINPESDIFKDVDELDFN